MLFRCGSLLSEMTKCVNLTLIISFFSVADKMNNSEIYKLCHIPQN